MERFDPQGHLARIKNMGTKEKASNPLLKMKQFGLGRKVD